MKTFKYVGQEAKNLGRFGMVSTGDVLQLNNSEAVSVSDNPEFELFTALPASEKEEDTSEKTEDDEDKREGGEEEVKAPEEEVIVEEEKPEVVEEATEAVEQAVEEIAPKSKRERRKA